MLRLTAAFAAAVVVAAPATAQRERLSLSERVTELEARLGNPEDRETLTDLVLRLGQMEQEIRDLRGLVEEQSFEIDNLKASQRDLYLDLDRRLANRPIGLDGDRTTLEPAQPGADPLTQGDPGRPPVQSDTGYAAPRRIPGSADPQPLGAEPVPLDQAAVPLQGEVPEVREPVEAELETTGLGGQQPAQVATLADPIAEKNAYNEAFDALKSGRYAESARLFSSFLDRFPGGEFADNAQYWLGESYYVTGNYRIALEAFQDLLSRFPQSAKAPDARLKLGYTYFSLKEWDQAERVLKDVIEQYPNSTVSRLAENRLRTMRIQGHIQ